MIRERVECSRLLLWLLLIPGLVLNLGCQPKKSASSQTTQSVSIKKVVAVCFLKTLAEDAKPGVFTNPLSGSIVPAEPVSEDIVLKMSDVLFSKVAEEKNYELVPRKQAIGVYSSILASDQKVGISALKVMQALGKAFDADAVLVGYLYRWRERIGKDYGVDRPASVAFDLYLIRSFDSAIMWRSKFDKTQKSLSENILDMDTFLEGGGKWMDAETLAMIGLRKMIEEMPRGMDASGK